MRANLPLRSNKKAIFRGDFIQIAINVLSFQEGRFSPRYDNKIIAALKAGGELDYSGPQDSFCAIAYYGAADFF
jgi:hypothetical protein